jgi:hypothetical protein
MENSFEKSRFVGKYHRVRECYLVLEQACHTYSLHAALQRTFPHHYWQIHNIGNA